MQIDNHTNKKKSLPSAIRTVNVAESYFEDNAVNVSPDDLSHVGAYSDESAAITLEEWEVNVAKQKSNRKPWPGNLPDDVWKSLSAAHYHIYNGIYMIVLTMNTCTQQITSFPTLKSIGRNFIIVYHGDIDDAVSFQFGINIHTTLHSGGRVRKETTRDGIC